MGERVLRIKETCHRTGLSRATLWRRYRLWLETKGKQGIGPKVVDGGTSGFRESGVIAYIERQTVTQFTEGAQ